MTYRIARNGDIYGPYSLMEVERHLASGHIVATDLGQGDGQQEWLPVAALFPAAAPQDGPTHPGGLPHLFLDPPDLNWGIVLVLGIFTLNIFSVLWDVYECFWFRRIERRSLAIWFYAASAITFFMKLPTTWHSILYNIGFSDVPSEGSSLAFTLITIILAIASRFVFRAELLKHFNHREPIGLHLNWLFTLLFGGLYFQYHFNRINEVKRALRVSVPG